MPRGRGRKHGPRRTSPTSRPQQSDSQSSVISPRRSSRIAEANSRSSPAANPTTSPMTDVARRTHLSQCGARSHEANVSRQRTRPRPRRTQAEPHGFALDFVVRPPSEVQAGSPIAPAVILQVRTVRRGPSSAGSDRSLHRYFAVVSLIQLYSDGYVENAPHGTLAGDQLADSIHTPESVTSTPHSPDVLGYFSFPNLIIRSSGTYRIRISLMKVGSSTGPTHGSSFLHSEDSGLIVVT